MGRVITITWVGVKIPWLGDKIPWVGGQNTMGRRFDIPLTKNTAK